MEVIMKHSYKYFENKDCQFFPCHEPGKLKAFNCLFCFCPLYFLGENCGGNFERVAEGSSVKDCSGCLMPHDPENYELLMKKIGEHIRQF